MLWQVQGMSAVSVVVAPIRATMVSWLVRGVPRRFMLIAAGVAAGSEVYMETEDVDPKKRALARAAIGGISTVGVLLPFSRLHESEADAIGVRFAAGAGYDPRAAVTFWQRMQKANEGRAEPWKWFSTHPSNETRIKALSELAPKYLPLYEEKKAHFEAIENGASDAEIGAP